ncbi:hypothetical protein AB0H12_37595 [Actinosynnema sp. NPDC023794]
MSTPLPSVDSVRKPWGAAARLFRVPPPADSPALGRVSSWRSVLGLLTLIVLGRGDRGVVDTLNEDGWGKTVENVIIALAIVPVAVLLLYLRTHREPRAGLRLRPVIGKIALLLLTTFGAMAPIVLVVTNDLFDTLKPTDFGTAVLALFGGLLAIAYALWVAVYVGCAAWWAVRGSCFIGEFHPLLGPAVTTAVVVTATAVELVEADTNGVSDPVWLTLTLGGLVTTLVLAAVEYSMLRARRIGWRTGPRPQPVPRPGDGVRRP